jgi:CRISPR-associated endonuclease/helicase Cas3
LRTAAALHDWGKADERFQALLLNGDRATAWAQEELWAKSQRIPRSRAARERAELPRGFRHEMLSTQLALLTSRLPEDERQRVLVLHLIASHHGHARPFAPFVDDSDPPEIAVNTFGDGVALTADDRRRAPAHALDSRIAERFWQLQRAFGPWTVAWIETTLRLADQVASEDRADDTSPVETKSDRELPLS